MRSCRRRRKRRTLRSPGRTLAGLATAKTTAVATKRHRIRFTERSEEHTSELQSLAYLVCRLLLEKKKKQNQHTLILPEQQTIPQKPTPAYCRASPSSNLLPSPPPLHHP